MSSMKASELKKEIKRLDSQIESLEASAKQSVQTVQDKTKWAQPLGKQIAKHPVPWVIGAVVAGVVLTQSFKKGSKKSTKSANAKEATLLSLLGVELKRWAAKEAISYVQQAVAKRSPNKSS